MSSIAAHHSVFLQSTLNNNGWNVPLTIQDAWLQYLYLMSRWNRVYDLTAIQQMDDMILRHIMDSICISDYLQGTRILDVGTGAGLPGIPLALLHPDKSFTLIDSHHKKIRFLTQVKLDLSIHNIDIVHSRCEQFQPQIGFDTILSRAFASLPDMLKTTQSLLQEDGQWLAMKGKYPQDELNAVFYPFIIHAVYPLEIIGLSAERHVICVKKHR